MFFSSRIDKIGIYVQAEDEHV